MAGEGIDADVSGQRPVEASARDLWVLVITAAGLLLRLRDLSREALWFDEVNSLWRTAGESLRGVLARIAGDVQAPLYDVVLWVWTAGGVRGTGEAFVRLPSVLCSAALIPVTAAIAQSAGGSRRAARLAAGLVALAPFQIRYAQEARPYALLALLAGLALLGTLRALRSAGSRGLALLAVSTTLLVLTHYYGVLLFAALALVLLLQGAAFGARLPRLVFALLFPAVVLLAWAPVAVRQFSAREMNSVYETLGASQLLDILDAQGVHGALGLRDTLLQPVLGSAVVAAPAAVWVGRLLLLALMLCGMWGAGTRSGACVAPAASPSTRAAACRAPAFLVLLLGALALVAGVLVPSSAVEDGASWLLKGGRALDADNLAAIGVVRRLAWITGIGLVLAAGLVAALPALVARCPRWTSMRVPLAAAVALPLLFTALLDLSGKHTLATRNMIVLMPAVAVLAALGWASLRPALRWAALVPLLLLALASLALAEPYASKADWRGAARCVADSGVEPLAHPPWIARCVEFHTGRPWNSVFGSYRAEDVASWAAARPGVVLVTQFEELAPSASVRDMLQAQFGPPRRSAFEGGLHCDVYGMP